MKQCNFPYLFQPHAFLARALAILVRAHVIPIMTAGAILCAGIMKELVIHPLDC